MTTVILALVCLCIALTHGAYIPKYLEGKPVSANVVSLGKKLDLTGLPTYLVKFQVKTANGSIVDSFGHRTNDDFDKLHEEMPKAFWFWQKDPFVFPTVNKNITNLHQFMIDIFKSDDAINSQVYADF